MRTKRPRISIELILDVARQLFSKKGYGGTSIGDITGRLGVSKPALYYYFKNKMEILETLHSKAFKELIDSYERLDNSDIPPEKKFVKIVENHANVVAKNVDLVKIFFLDEKEIPKKVVKTVREKRRAYTKQLIQLFQKGVKKGAFRDVNPKIAVYGILGACNWLLMWYTPTGRLDSCKIADTISDLLYTGYSSDKSQKDNKEIFESQIKKFNSEKS